MNSHLNAVRATGGTYACTSQTLDKIVKEGVLPNSFMEASIVLMLKLDNDLNKTKLQASICNKHRGNT